MKIRAIVPSVWRAGLLLAGAVGAAGVAGGCSSSRQELMAPETLVSPYPASAEPLWAVAPLRNDSGTSVTDGSGLADALVARLNEVRGLTVLPMNRTLAAMRSLGMVEVATAEDAVALADALGVDAIIAGSLTAYDPYDPPKVGFALGLYRGARAAGAESSRGAGAGGDPKAIQTAARDGQARWSGQSSRPLVVVSEHLDAANHGVLMNVKRFAEGRHEPDAAFGWRRYTASMGHFEEFSAYWAAYRLLQEERLRLVRPGMSGQGAVAARRG